MTKLHLKNGYIYYQDIDQSDDNIKITHIIESPDGKKDYLDWSPYRTPSERTLNLFVELNFPKRIGVCPLDENDLESIKQELNYH